MPRKVDVSNARKLLEDSLSQAEEDQRNDAIVGLPEKVVSATNQIFASKTQAFREGLVGCAVAHILDPKIDIRYPATKYGDNSFSGRAVSETIIAPFLRAKRIPISVSPYLSALRGGAQFVKDKPPRELRDKAGWEALVDLVDYLKDLDEPSSRKYLTYLLRRFIRLRESTNILLKKTDRPNLELLSILTEELLKVKSGGRLPVVLAVAMFRTLSECHKLGWEVAFQGINVADKASGAVGDITITKAGSILLGVEVTERPVDSGRVELVFDDKVSPKGLTDYLFITTHKPEPDAITKARGYTAVGHEMNFVDLHPWLIHNLSTVGPACRAIFQSHVIKQLEEEGIPADLKVAWNDKMSVAIAPT